MTPANWRRREEGAEIMANINAFTGVGVAGMPLPRRIPRFGRTPPLVPQVPFRRSASAAPPPRLDSPWIGAPPRYSLE